MSSSKGVKNLYSAVEPSAEVLEARERANEAARQKLRRIVTVNPGRKPDWSPERLQELDTIALEHGKRCIMWDDEGCGFYLMMNWDWGQNCPAKRPDDPEKAMQSGWYAAHKQMLKAPLLDPTVPEDKLAAWIHEHTMHVHQFLDEQGRKMEAPSSEAA